MSIKSLAVLPLAALALAFAGCSSYSEIARWKSDVPINDGEVPVATFLTQNFSYQLLGCIPLCTGRPWTKGNAEVVDDFNVRPFADEAIAALDRNIAAFQQFSAWIDEYWGGYNRLLVWCPDHGAHESAPGRGAHGTDMPEDLLVYHFYSIRAKNK